MKRIVIFASIFLLAFATPASAHTTLVSADPAVDSFTSVWPASIELTFAEDLAKISGATSNFVTVTNAAAVELNTGSAVVAGAKISVPVAPNTVTGPVLVSYRISAQDGHVVEGEYSFNFQGSKPAISVPGGEDGNGEEGGNLLISGVTTLLVVLTLLFGIWAYRKRKS